LTYGKRIESLLQTVGLPGLADIRFATGEDHDGDPVIRIWVFLTDAEDDAFLSSARELRALIGGTARKVAPDRFPHINFCGMTEQVELENEMAVERMFRALEGVAS